MVHHTGGEVGHPEEHLTLPDTLQCGQRCHDECLTDEAMLEQVVAASIDVFTELIEERALAISK